MAVFWSDLNLSIKILCLLAKFFIGRDLYFKVCGCEPTIWQKSACNLNGFYFKKRWWFCCKQFFFYFINWFFVSHITNAVNYFTGSLIDEFRKFHRKHLMRDCALHCVGVFHFWSFVDFFGGSLHNQSCHSTQYYLSSGQLCCVPNCINILFSFFFFSYLTFFCFISK